MTARDSAESHRIGLSAAFAGGLLLSIDVPILRMAATDAWTMIFVRGGLSFFALWLFWLTFRRAKGEGAPFVNGYTSVVLSCLTAVASILFLNAIQLTTVANVVFILAFNPMFAALLSWLVLGERTPLVTILAIVASFAGVLIIVWDSIVAGTHLGDLMALGVSLLLACSLVIARRSGTDQSMSPAFGTLLAAVGVMWFAQPGSLPVESWGWLALNGLIVMPAASACMMLGPRYVSAPVVAMFFLLETVLTPIWMWLIFNEVPRTASLMGGVVIFVALLGHSIWKLQERADRPHRVSNEPPMVPKV
jgi:drug/metabolite transporter (DMT)-like permease